MNSAKRRKTSPLWAYFTELSGNEKKAKCDMCSQKLSYRSSISNLKKHLDTFKLSNKVLIAVTDNNCNIKKAINSHLQRKHFGCYALTLNLIVQDSLEEVQELVNKIKTIVAHFKRSTTANEKLIAYQQN
jgi:hypothetical protein